MWITFVYSYMGKQILFLCLMCLGLFIKAEAQEGFKITGKLGGTLGGNLILVANTEKGTVQLGQTVMVNGNFSFTGKVG